MTGQQAGELARRMELHLRYDNFDACRDILDEKEKMLAERPSKRKALAETDIALRWVAMLERAGYIYVDQLEGKDLKEVCKKITNMGPCAIKELGMALGVVTNKKPYAKLSPCRSHGEVDD